MPHPPAPGMTLQSIAFSGSRVTIGAQDASRIDRERPENALRRILGPETTVALGG